MNSSDSLVKWLLVSVTSVFVGLLAFGGFFMFRTTQALLQAVSDPTSLVQHFLPVVVEDTQADERGCTNILVLGGGGKEYDDGSELVDSIMVASLCRDPAKLVFTSIPRDLVLKLDNFGYRKINTLYILAKHQLGEEHAFDLMWEAAEKITNLPMHYYAYVDFRGFVDIFDALTGSGGLMVDVNPGFVDHEFPGPNYSYRTLRFEQGPQSMDGEIALQYVRSRHGVSLDDSVSVASDFDRSRRQQQIISLLKDKIKDIFLSDDAAALIDTATALQKNYSTDITFRDMLLLAGLWKKVDPSHVYNIVLKEGPGELLYVPSQEVRDQLFNGGWILRPDGDTFDTIHKYIARVLNNPEMALRGTVPVEVLNGTKVRGLAGKVANTLMQEGITIYPQYGIRNTYGKKQYEKTILIDRSSGQNLELLKETQRILGKGEIIAETKEPEVYSMVGVTIILGEDYVENNQAGINSANIDIEDYWLQQRKSPEPTPTASSETQL